MLRWTGHGAHMGLIRNVYTFFNGKSERRGRYEYLGTDGRNILKWPKGK
jgi:hypothetical protein